ncbi:MAG: sigma 54-interacting transcriptional regulator [Clostridiaceae bacterium]|nr:sigma 54-interacting transcriptional regulator [Clostridiaceae bacterium]
MQNKNNNPNFCPKEISEMFLSMTSLLFDQLPIPINLVDVEGTIIAMNKAFLEFLHLKERDVIGKSITEIDPTVRLPIVLKTGRAEIGQAHRFQDSRSAIVHRIPLFYNGTIIGGVGVILFDDLKYLYNLITEHDMMRTSIPKEQKKLGDIYMAKYDFDAILTQSPSGIKCKEVAKTYSNTDFSVLITGESGVGKELFAHAIHKNSRRKNGPFIRINCAAIPDALLESELFGYEEGAFTGANKSGRKGKFELANGGTIFLDEIGDLPSTMQVKLLRVLQEREIEKVGGNKIIDLDIRVIAATNADLEKRIEEGTFRSDLFYRLNVLNLKIPPLRDRQEDVPLLIQHFVTSIYQDFEIYKKFPEEIIKLLKDYHWPGNVRELKNTVDRIVVNTTGELVKRENLPQNILESHHYKVAGYKASTSKKGSLKKTLAEIEKKIILETIEEYNGNKAESARALGIPRMTLYRKLQEISS